MNKELTEMVFILDRSGSMAGLESDTIGGFNAMVDKQKKEEGKALLSAVLFSDQSTVIYDRVDIEKVEPMNDRQYQVGGCP
ncbi:MAG: VWA domain-containing protein, partial [Oscillospiraceae bacterium]|nr:VWA domain-containing protein [Oscillospiraceae bacterium]